MSFISALVKVFHRAIWYKHRQNLIFTNWVIFQKFICVTVVQRHRGKKSGIIALRRPHEFKSSHCIQCLSLLKRIILLYNVVSKNIYIIYLTLISNQHLLLQLLIRSSSFKIKGKPCHLYSTACTN